MVAGKPRKAVIHDAFVCVECGRTSNVNDFAGDMVCCGLEMVSELEILWGNCATELIKRIPLTSRESLIQRCAKHHKKKAPSSV
jgi:hypothetical protein